jgi:hypothetical protein
VKIRKASLSSQGRRPFMEDLRRGALFFTRP